jgi:hypothetical protein
MVTTKGSTRTIDDYLILLKNLEFSQKLQIISELSDSMIKEQVAQPAGKMGKGDLYAI